MRPFQGHPTDSKLQPMGFEPIAFLLRVMLSTAMGKDLPNCYGTDELILNNYLSNFKLFKM